MLALGLGLGLGLGFHSSFYYEPDGDKSNLAIWFRKSDNAEAAQRHGLDDPGKNPKARLFVLGFVFVFDHPELQIQAGHPGGEEGRIQYARAHMEAHELQVSRVRIAGHGVPQVAKRRRSEGQEIASTSGVGEEAGGDALGNERGAVSESEGRGG